MKTIDHLIPQTIENILTPKSERFSTFAELLREYNAKYNLTSILDDDGIRTKHFLDSVMGAFLFPQGANCIEIGSGGGFPSIPVMIARSDLSFTLVESTGKKCEYLKEVTQKLGCNNVIVCNIRAEDGGRDIAMREQFDVACARAVARLNTLCEYCLPFVKVGGKFLAYKGNAEEEIDEAKNAVKVLGGKITGVYTYDLPDDSGKRTIVEITKISSTPKQYPRGQGKERKKPL